MRDQGSCWRRPDGDEMDDAGRGCHAEGMLTARGSGAGGDFERRLQAEAVRSPAWAQIGQAWGVMVDGSNAEVGFRKVEAERLPNRFCLGQPRGRCQVMRRAMRVMRPAREKKRRRRVLVVATGSPNPLRVVQPGSVGGEASRGLVVETHAVLEIADGVFDLSVAARSGSS